MFALYIQQLTEHQLNDYIQTYLINQNIFIKYYKYKSYYIKCLYHLIKSNNFDTTKFPYYQKVYTFTQYDNLLGTYNYRCDVCFNKFYTLPKGFVRLYTLYTYCEFKNQYDYDLLNFCNPCHLNLIQQSKDIIKYIENEYEIIFNKYLLNTFNIDIVDIQHEIGIKLYQLCLNL
jgi:hypothetical protein